MSAASRIPVPIRTRYVPPRHDDLPILTPLEQLRDDFQNKLQYNKQLKHYEYPQQRNPQPFRSTGQKPIISGPRGPPRVALQKNGVRNYPKKDFKGNDRANANNRFNNAPSDGKLNNVREPAYRNKIRYNGQYKNVNERRDKEPKIIPAAKGRSVDAAHTKNSAGRDRANPLAPIGPGANWKNKLANPENKPEFGDTYTVNMAKQRAEEKAGRHLPVQRRSTRVIRPIDKMGPWQPQENDELKEEDDNFDHRLTAEERYQLNSLKQKQLSKNKKFEEDVKPSITPNNITINRNAVSRNSTFTGSSTKPNVDRLDEIEVPQRQMTDDSEWLERTQKIYSRRNTAVSDVPDNESTYSIVKRKLKSTDNLLKGKDDNAKFEMDDDRDRDTESRGELSKGVKSRLPPRSRLESRASRTDGLASQLTQYDEQDSDVRLKKKKIFERQRLLSRQYSDDGVDESALREKEEALEKLIRQHSIELSNLKRDAHRIHRPPEVKNIQRIDSTLTQQQGSNGAYHR